MANSSNNNSSSDVYPYDNLIVPNEKLRWNCSVDRFNFNSTKELSPLRNIVGQPRAIEAITMGAVLRAKGFNIFVTGLSGTGRLTTVESILETVTNSCPIPNDYCYVNNFKNEDEPRLIVLQRGKAREFSDLMDEAIIYLRENLPKLFEDNTYQSKKKKLVEEVKLKEKSILDEFDSRLRKHNFVRGNLEVVQGVLQPEVFPIINGEAIAIETVEELLANNKISQEDADRLKELWHKFHNEIFELSYKTMKLIQQLRKSLNELDKNHSRKIISNAFDAIQHSFENEKISIYLEEVKQYILDNLQLFVNQQIVQPSGMSSGDELSEDDSFRVFKVNIILDSSAESSARVVVETTPSYNNLFGTIERVYDKRGGYWRTDFTKIKAGSLLKADKGYLIVNANDLFAESGAWQALKRVLLYDKLEIQNYDSFFQLAQASLKPEPINVNVKVIIIGGLSLYHLLFHYEKGFKKIFKIHAQFDYETEQNDNMINNVACFIAKVCNDDKLQHFAPGGVAAIIEWAVEAAGSQSRITLKFSDIADIVRESAFFGGESPKSLIDKDAVIKAIEARRRRNDLIDEKIKRQIIDEYMLIDTKGERIGQINGLTVFNNGFISFGKPARITATISAGNSGIINVEREADLSGNIHNKAVLILNGFLREKFASKRPLSLTASIAFEQSYGGIDGDSATAAEIYIILSAIAKIPIRQSLAITGSVNQKGDIQPIGGVNEKIRGFFEVCKQRNFDGTRQGVIIPIQNVPDLMLCEEIISDIEQGNFAIYAISNIDEGVPLLMNIEAGSQDDLGAYPIDSLYGLVNSKLDEMFELSKKIFNERKG